LRNETSVGESWRGFFSFQNTPSYASCAVALTVAVQHCSHRAVYHMLG